MCGAAKPFNYVVRIRIKDEVDQRIMNYAINFKYGI